MKKSKMDIQEIRDRSQAQAQKIADQAVFNYLSTQSNYTSDIAIAAELELPMPLVRRELADLINQGLVRVKSFPAKVTTAGGLKYKCQDQ